MYRCRDCGERFTYNWLADKAAKVGLNFFGPICVDPAPSLAGLFEKCRCPKCHSKRVELSNEYTAKLRALQRNERETRYCRKDIIDDMLADREITSIQRHDEPRFSRQDVVDNAIQRHNATSLEELCKEIWKM